MKLLLDTHIFLWFISGDGRLPAAWRDAFRNPENDVYLSVA
jgi:PIN domain nuclease of toxin-antitoxin system